MSEEQKNTQTEQQTKPQPKNTIETIAGSIVDLGAILVVGLLAFSGKAPVELALILIALLAGVRLKDIVGSGKVGSGLSGVLVLATSGIIERLFHWGKITAVVLGVLLSGQHFAGCSSTPRQVAHVAIVSSASVVNTIANQNRAIYERETRAVISRLEASNGSFEDYQRQTTPLREEFNRRAELIRVLDTIIYDAAAVNDLANSSNEQRLHHAGILLDRLARTLEALNDASQVLPNLSIPPEVFAVMRSLSAIAGRPPDLGEDNEETIDAGVGEQ